MKRIIGCLLGCALVVTAQGASLAKTNALAWLHPIGHHRLKAHAPALAPGFTDFSGEWVGGCTFADDTDDDDQPIHLRIENDANWIKITQDDASEVDEIGKDSSQHQDDRHGFSVSHTTFNWLNNATLLFNIMQIDVANDQVPNLARSVNSVLGRVVWTLVGDKLMMRFEMQEFVNDDEAYHTIGTCEYQRE